jgi:hypothetical protein
MMEDVFLYSVCMYVGVCMHDLDVHVYCLTHTRTECMRIYTCIHASAHAKYVCMSVVVELVHQPVARVADCS